MGPTGLWNTLDNNTSSAIIRSISHVVRMFVIIRIKLSPLSSSRLHTTLFRALHDSPHLSKLQAQPLSASSPTSPRHTYRLPRPRPRPLMSPVDLFRHHRHRRCLSHPKFRPTRRQNPPTPSTPVTCTTTSAPCTPTRNIRINSQDWLPCHL